MKKQRGRAPGAVKKARKTNSLKQAGKKSLQPAASEVRSATAKPEPELCPKPARRRRPIGPPVANPGGYCVLDGTTPAARGKTREIGRIVRKTAGRFEAWNKVEGGYVLIGAFDQTDKAIAALGTLR